MQQYKNPQSKHKYKKRKMENSLSIHDQVKFYNRFKNLINKEGYHSN